jgi:GYF domain 2
MSDDAPRFDPSRGAHPHPQYGEKADEAVTVSMSTEPGDWLVNTADAVIVPMSASEVLEGVRAGRLAASSLVWRQGMPEWAPLGSIPQLAPAARLLPAQPPGGAPASSQPLARRATTAPSPSRRPTLPLGLAIPSSRPAHAKPTLPPAARSSDESEVLAVYTRPAATISFELPAEAPPAREAPERAPRAAAPPPGPLETLAPTTSDSAPRTPPRPRRSEPAVAANAEHRDVERRGKRPVLLWSVSSAAAASLLTFWLARTTDEQPPVVPVKAATVAIPTSPLAPPLAPTASVEAASAPSAVPSAATPVEPARVPAPRKTARAKAARPKPSAPPAEALPPASAAVASEKDPNPFDVTLEEDPPAGALPRASAAPPLSQAPTPAEAAAEPEPTSDSSL